MCLDTTYDDDNYATALTNCISIISSKDGTKKVQVFLKLLVADGSATGIAWFNTADFSQSPEPATTTTIPRLLDVKELDALASVLGLDLATTNQLIGQVTQDVWVWTPSAQHSHAREGLLSDCLESWFSSPGFLRPVHLPLKPLQHSIISSTYCDWKLRKAVLDARGGGSVLLATPPYLRLRVAPCIESQDFEFSHLSVNF